MPGSTLFKAFVLFVALWAPVTQADSGWQPVQDTIRKSEKDTRQYQAIRLDNGMTVLLVSDPQAVKSLSALVVSIGSLEDPEAQLLAVTAFFDSLGEQMDRIPLAVNDLAGLVPKLNQHENIKESAA